MMKAWQEFSTPAPPHKMVAKCAGEWKADVTQWMSPGEPPSKSKSTVKSEMIMGDRYLASHYKGTMMGQPFDGMGIMVYDHASKKFYNNWVDNMSTGLAYFAGGWKESGKVIEMKATYMDPVSGKEETMREVMTLIDDRQQKMEMYGTLNGQEMKVMEMIMSKQSGIFSADRGIGVTLHL